MIRQIKDLLQVLTAEQRIKLIWLQLLVVISAIFELAGVLAIGPFIAIVGNIDLIEASAIFGELYRYSGVSNAAEFLVVVGFFVLILLCLAAIFSIFTIWKLSIFAADVGAEFGDRLYQYYMGKSYLYHTSTNSSDLVRKIATEVSRVTDNVLQPLVQINARIVTILFISIFIFVYNPYVSILGFTILSTAYFILYVAVRNKLSTNGKLISEYSRKRFSLMNEGFGAIKEIEVLGRKKNFVDKFKASGRVFAHAYGTSNGLYNTPRYLMEFVVYSSMVGLILLLLKTYKGDLSAVLPVMGVFGIAAFKMLPSFQQIYSGAAQIRNNVAAFEAVRFDLADAISASEYQDSHPDQGRVTGDISLRDVSFKYKNNDVLALKNITIDIPFRSSVGIVGPSGSGKSTLLDVLIGAIRLDNGELVVGERAIDEMQLPHWRNSIGYVSQISLIKDGSIAENIAFGMEHEDIDQARLVQAAKLAHLHDWINSLPASYETQVGERGLQISGGQRQRIAIARALYKDADYLFFDEATSALDGITENNIMDAIEEMAGIKTVVMIAHRLNTVKHCDRIYLISAGQVKGQGTYESLVNSNEEFNNMAGFRK